MIFVNLEYCRQNWVCIIVKHDLQGQYSWKELALNGLMTHHVSHARVWTGAVLLYIQLTPWRYTTDHIWSWSLESQQVITTKTSYNWFWE